MVVQGKEAAAALSAVEAQQRRLTFQRIVVAMIVEVKQETDSAPPVIPTEDDAETDAYFLAEVMHPFTAESKKELSLEKGVTVIVRQVNSSGWAEGECKGRAGWFPSAYMRKRNKFASNNQHY